MTLLTIEQVLATEPGKIITGVRGTIKHVAERYTGIKDLPDGTKKDWSLQDIVIEGDGKELPVHLANKDPIAPEWIGRSLVILAHQKERGGLSGVKMDEEEGKKILRVSASGEITLADSGANVGAPAPANVEIQKQAEAPLPTGGTVSVPNAPTAVPPSPLSPAWKNVAFEVNKRWNLYQICLRRVVSDAAKVGANPHNHFGPAHIQRAAQAIFESFFAGVEDWDIPNDPIPPERMPQPISPQLVEDRI